MPLRIALGHHRIQHHAGVFAEMDRQIEPRQRFGQRTGDVGAAGLHDHDVVGQTGDFIRGVADVEHGNIQFLVQAFQIGQDFLLARQIERGQRFVHQQQARFHRQRAGDADALAFAAGELVRATFEQSADAEQVDDMVEGGGVEALRRALHAVFEIAARGQMREQAGFLEHVAQ
jgi:hypothetical protein